MADGGVSGLIFPVSGRYALRYTCLCIAFHRTSGPPKHGTGETMLPDGAVVLGHGGVLEVDG